MVCPYDTLLSMSVRHGRLWSRRSLLGAGGIALFADLAIAQEEFEIFGQNPRLLLTAQRLRLLRRERERESIRWQQLDLLIRGNAQMAEPGFAFALYYQTAKDRAVGEKAVRWAASAEATDVRQLALVYDWTQDLLSPPAKTAIEKKLIAALSGTEPSFAAVRNRVLAAVSLGPVADKQVRATLSAVVNQWWRKQIAPGLLAGKTAITHTDAYPFMETVHAIRDNLTIDLRENAGPFFRDYPATRVLSYYPARYPAPENEYRIPYYSGRGDPDLKLASLTRAAEMALVAYDNNAVQTQFVHGFVADDSLSMKSAFGAPYEFLWANPYQPGLSYHHLPLRLHDPRSGRLFLRTSWDDDAEWAAHVDGRLQVFRGGKIEAGEIGTPQSPAIFGEATLVKGQPQMKWELAPETPPDWFIVGMKPRYSYNLEVDDEELTEAISDNGGIIALTLPRRDKPSIRLEERGPSTTAPDTSVVRPNILKEPER